MLNIDMSIVIRSSDNGKRRTLINIAGDFMIEVPVFYQKLSKHI